MPRHLTSDEHESINEIPTVPICCLANPQPRELACTPISTPAICFACDMKSLRSGECNEQLAKALGRLCKYRAVLLRGVPSRVCCGYERSYPLVLAG
jgi:hypothetical protein